MTEVKENGRVLLVKRQEKILTLLYNENPSLQRAFGSIGAGGIFL